MDTDNEFLYFDPHLFSAIPAILPTLANGATLVMTSCKVPDEGELMRICGAPCPDGPGVVKAIEPVVPVPVNIGPIVLSAIERDDRGAVKKLLFLYGQEESDRATLEEIVNATLRIGLQSGKVWLLDLLDEVNVLFTIPDINARFTKFGNQAAMDWLNLEMRQARQEVPSKVYRDIGKDVELGITYQRPDDLPRSYKSFHGIASKK